MPYWFVILSKARDLMGCFASLRMITGGKLKPSCTRRLTYRLGILCGAFVSVALLPAAVGTHAFAQQPRVSSGPVSAIPGPSRPQEQILSPVPEPFEWMQREVRPNPLLEALLALREGPPRLFMSVSLTEDYSDNFSRREPNRAEEYRTSLSIGSVYRLESGWSFVSLANSISASHEARSQQSNFGFANLSLNAGHRSPPWSLALSESLVRSDETEDASLSGIRRGRGPFLRNQVSPQVHYDFSRITSVNLAYTNTLVLNEEQAGVNIGPLFRDKELEQGMTLSHAITTSLQHQLARGLRGSASYTLTAGDGGEGPSTQAHSASASLGYLLDPLTTLSLQAFGSTTDRSNRGGDSQTYGASIGVQRAMTSFLTALVSIKPTVLNREDQGQRILLNWQANLDGALPVFLARRTSLTLSGQQSVDDTVGDVNEVGLVLRQSLTLSLNHAASRDLRTSVSVNYIRTELLEDVGTRESVRGRKDQFWTADGRVTYAFTPFVSLSASYRYQQRASNLAGGDFNENRITVALSASLPVF